MKILLIASFPDSLITFRGTLIAALLEKGLDVYVAAPDMPLHSPIRIKLQSMGVIAHQIPMLRTGTNPFADLFTLCVLIKLMAQIKPNMILSYTVKPVIFGTLAAWVTRIPLRFAMITGLGYTFQDNKKHSYLQIFIQFLYKFALARAHHVFFQNVDDLSLFQERSILTKSTSASVINGSGVDLDQFAVMPFPLDTLTNGRVRFLFIGRLLGSKGVREYVQASRLIKTSHPNAQFTLVGWIDYGPDSISEAELAEWVSDGSIKYLGKLADVRPAIDGCSVYVLPSYREGTPRSVLEAMAMGRPIITTDAPGCRETVVDGDNGFLVPVKDVHALVKAMEKFILDPSLLFKMGKRSRAIAEEKYDVHKVNKLMLKAMSID